MTTPVALVVDDDAVSRLVVSHMLRQRGYSVDEAVDVADAGVQVQRTRYDLVVSDFQLPSGTGIDVLDSVEMTSASVTPFLLITGILGHASVTADIEARITGHLTKPISSVELDEALGLLAHRPS